MYGTATLASNKRGAHSRPASLSRFPQRTTETESNLLAECSRELRRVQGNEREREKEREREREREREGERERGRGKRHEKLRKVRGASCTSRLGDVMNDRVNELAAAHVYAGFCLSGFSLVHARLRQRCSNWKKRSRGAPLLERREILRAFRRSSKDPPCRIPMGDPLRVRRIGRS